MKQKMTFYILVFSRALYLHWNYFILTVGTVSYVLYIVYSQMRVNDIEIMYKIE